jgi:hypothetical protein
LQPVRLFPQWLRQAPSFWEVLVPRQHKSRRAYSIRRSPVSTALAGALHSGLVRVLAPPLPNFFNFSQQRRRII